MAYLSTSAHRHLYLANATVLLAHQIDAAYWHEWTLFRLPGGPAQDGAADELHHLQVFVLSNLPIVLAILIGTERLPSRAGRRISALLAASGLFAAVFHSGHLLDGDEAFRTPVSLTLLGLTAVLSPLQFLALRRTRPAPPALSPAAG